MSAFAPPLPPAVTRMRADLLLGRVKECVPGLQSEALPPPGVVGVSVPSEVVALSSPLEQPEPSTERATASVTGRSASLSDTTWTVVARAHATARDSCRTLEPLAWNTRPRRMLCP